MFRKEVFAEDVNLEEFNHTKKNLSNLLFGCLTNAC